MRIGIDGRVLCDRYPGIGRATSTLLLALAAESRADLVVFHVPGETAHPLETLVAAGIELAVAPAGLRSLAEHVRLPGMARAAGASADIVHLHVPHPPGEVAWLLARRRPPAVATYHSDIVRQRWLGALLRPVLHAVLGRTRRILATSRRYADTSAVLRRHRDRIEVVPLGIDPVPFDVPPSTVRRWHDRFPPPLVLLVGRLRHYKGVVHLIAAMDRLHATLLVAGEGHEAERLRACAARSQANTRIHLLGDVDPAELPALYAAADVRRSGGPVPVPLGATCGPLAECARARPGYRAVGHDEAVRAVPFAPPRRVFRRRPDQRARRLGRAGAGPRRGGRELTQHGTGRTRPPILSRASMLPEALGESRR